MCTLAAALRVRQTALLVLLFATTISVSAAQAGTIRLQWDPSPEADIAGYMVWVGTEPGVYTNSFDVGNTTTFDYVEPVAGERYYFAVTAYTTDLLFSPMSAEVVANVNAAPTLVNPGDQTHDVGLLVALALDGSDPDGTAVTYGASGLPSGLSLDTATGLIAGTLLSAGSFNVTVSASDGSLTTSQSFVWTVTLVRPVATTPISPVTTVSTRVPTFQWSSVPGVAYYYIKVFDATGAAWDRWYTDVQASCAGAATPTCAVSPGKTFSAGPAIWNVLTWNSAGYGPWSVNADPIFEVDDPSAPAPTALYPDDTVLTQRPAFMWTPVSSPLWYRIRVTDSTGVVSYQWHTPSSANCTLDTDTCAATSLQVLPLGTTSWVAQAWFPSGAGPWTPPMVFEVASAPPPAPVLAAPAWTLENATPVFTWQASAGATYYYVHVYDNSGKRVDRWYTPLQAQCPTGVGLCKIEPGVTLVGGPGSWKALAWNESGYSRWSPSQSLLVPTAAPVRPTLIGPEGALSDNLPTLSWQAVAEATYYLVRITDADGRVIDKWYRPSGAGCITGSGTCAVNPGVALPGGSGSWSALAWNPLGYSPWAPAKLFTVP